MNIHTGVKVVLGLVAAGGAAYGSYKLYQKLSEKGAKSPYKKEKSDVGAEPAPKEETAAEAPESDVAATSAEPPVNDVVPEAVVEDEVIVKEYSIEVVAFFERFLGIDAGDIETYCADALERTDVPEDCDDTDFELKELVRRRDEEKRREDTVKLLLKLRNMSGVAYHEVFRELMELNGYHEWRKVRGMV